MGDVFEQLARIVGGDDVLVGDRIDADAEHDEALTVTPVRPLAVVRPGTTDEVAAIVALARVTGTPLTARGSATGLAGGCVPAEGGVVVSFERMDRILEIDTANNVAVVEPGVTLRSLEEALTPLGLVYPVYPGELSASLGGNVATNAGGMRAVKYGVTRHQVLGVTAVLGTGEVVTSGGKFVKSTSGYDLTQLIVGSEGTLALVTRAVLKLWPRPPVATTVLVPFRTLEEVSNAVPPIVASGIAPRVVEYIDVMSMAGITSNAQMDLGIEESVREAAMAYLVVVVEGFAADRVEEDVAALAGLVSELGALDVYVLPEQAGARLIEAREHAFWAAKAAGADDIVDVVVPRASIPEYLQRVGDLAAAESSLVVGCGHAGDGNVHLSVFQSDPEIRRRLVHAIVATGVAMGGAVSGEHGIGTEKKHALAELEDPVKLDLMRRIKSAFDPDGILNPGKVFDTAPAGSAR